MLIQEPSGPGLPFMYFYTLFLNVYEYSSLSFLSSSLATMYNAT